MLLCPHCNKPFFEPPALSRKDNTTEICSKCGVKEALESLLNESNESAEYITDLEEECENLSEHNRQLIERIKELSNV